MSNELKPVELSQEQLQELVHTAQQAATMAYAPYSNKPEGAALLTASGAIYSGASVEFATYGGSVSADVACLIKAINHGDKKIVALCIQPFSYPSGVVRQFYAEFGIDLSLVVPGPEGTLELKSWTTLLPYHFGPDNLEEAKNLA